VDRVDEGDNDGVVDSGVGVRVHAAGLDGVGNLIGQVDLAEGDPEGAAPD